MSPKLAAEYIWINRFAVTTHAGLLSILGKIWVTYRVVFLGRGYAAALRAFQTLQDSLAVELYIRITLAESQTQI